MIVDVCQLLWLYFLLTYLPPLYHILAFQIGSIITVLFYYIILLLSESSRYALSENSILYYAMTYCLGDIRVSSRRFLLNVC